jgi:hypothetical protein
VCVPNLEGHPNELVRKPRQLRRIGFLYGAFGFTGAAFLQWIAAFQAPPSGRATLTAIAAIAIVGALIVIQPALSWVMPTEDVLVVYNWPFRHVTAWSDVLAVADPPGGAIYITRRKGRRLTIRALSGNPRYDQSWRDPTLTEILIRADTARHS